MNAEQYSNLIDNSTIQHDSAIYALDEIIAKFPFFQNVRAVKLKNLYSQSSLQYNDTLKKTAAYTADRSVLFEYITSDDFIPVHIMENTQGDSVDGNKNSHETSASTLKEEQKTETDIYFIPKENNTTLPYQAEKLEKSIRDLIATDEMAVYNEIEFVKKQHTEEQPEEEIKKRLEIGKPLTFTPNEVHSFQEWLELATFKPIERVSTQTQTEVKIVAIDESKQKKNDIIDRFIASNPKISSVKNYVYSATSSSESDDNSLIMTETLAKVYLEQKKYQKAIQAYEILILKYPEKFSFFANRISEIKNLQQNNH